VPDTKVPEKLVSGTVHSLWGKTTLSKLAPSGVRSMSS